jgi:hypothetical protein
MLRQIKYFISWVSWITKGRPVITYTGFNCGLCGNWVKKEFSVPTYKSCGRWWDTWGICNKCVKG